MSKKAVNPAPSRHSTIKGCCLMNPALSNDSSIKNLSFKQMDNEEVLDELNKKEGAG